jgi:inorganic pyrophosphatase/exopolyphosphatase
MFPEATLRDHVLHIAGLVSRKKDFVPRMTAAVAALAKQ